MSAARHLPLKTRKKVVYMSTPDRQTQYLLRQLGLQPNPYPAGSVDWWKWEQMMLTKYPLRYQFMIAGLL